LKLLAIFIPFLLLGQSAPDAFLKWSEKQARETALSLRGTGRVGHIMGVRGLHTDRSISYKLRATWLTPDVIRASSRLAQLINQLTDAETLALVKEAEAAGDSVVMVELDPDEGSGIIPSSWSATLGSVGAGEPRVVRGERHAGLDSMKGLAGGARRDYNYDIFWVSFPLRKEDGAALFTKVDREAELTVRINDLVGTVRWIIPESVRQRSSREP
jgi:hypothetical protein